MAFQSPRQILEENKIWIVLFTVLGLLAISSVINEPGNQFGITYFVIWITVIAGFILSTLLGVSKVFEFTGGSKNNFLLQLLGGSFLGFVLVSSLWLGTSKVNIIPQLGSLVVPFSASLGLLAVNSLATIFIFGIFVPELEESFLSGLIQPSAREWLGNPILRKILMLVTGGILLLYVEPLRFLSWVLVIIGVIDLLIYSVLRKDGITDFIFGKYKFMQFIGSLVLKGVFFAILHYYAATTTGQDPTVFMISAFIFAVLGGLLNSAFGSTIPGKIAHSINNTTIMVLALGYPIYTVFFFVGAYIILLIGMYQVKAKDMISVNLNTVAIGG